MGSDEFSIVNCEELNVMGRRGHQKSNVGGWGGGGKNFRPTPPGHFKWNRPKHEIVLSGLMGFHVSCQSLVDLQDCAI